MVGFDIVKSIDALFGYVIVLIDLMFNKIDETLPIFIDHLFLSDYTVLISKQSPDKYEIVNNDEISYASFSRNDFTFTRDLATWNESTTLKYHGKTIAEIGEIINLNHTTIQKILRENDIKGRTAAYYKKKEMLIKYDTDKVVELYVSGFSMDRIAEDLNIGRGTVSKILHRSNMFIKSFN